MRVERIAEGLWRWTGLHPEWKEGDDWRQEVGCVYYEGPDAVVLFDPLVPPEARDEFFTALDRDVERVGLPVEILLTAEWHRRSTGELVERYGARLGGSPEGVEPRELHHAAEERAYWIPEHRALVVGDSILGGPTLAPVDWFEDASSYPAFVDSVRELLELPIERLLVSHGEPVLASARESLAQTLQAK